MPTRSSLAVARHALRELTLRRSLASPPIAPRASDAQAERALNAYNYVAMIAYHQSDVPAQLFSTFAALRLAPRVGPSPPAAQLYAAAGNVLGFAGLKEPGVAVCGPLAPDCARHRTSVVGWRRPSVLRPPRRAAGRNGHLRQGHPSRARRLHPYRPRAFEKRHSPTSGISRAFAASCRRRWRPSAKSNAQALLVVTNRRRRGGCWVRGGSGGLLGQTNEALRRLDEAVPKSRDDLSQMEGLGARALTLAQLGEDRARATTSPPS